MFQRRHYRKIAETLASDKPTGPKYILLGEYSKYRVSLLDQQVAKGAYDEWNTTCLAFVKMLAADNPRFDRERFLTWCNTKVS